MALLQIGRRFAQPITGVATWYNVTAKKNPWVTGFVTTGIKTSIADALAQKVFERREEFDYKRHAAFVTFGFFYLGGVQYWLYNVKFAQWCRGITETVGHKGVAPLKTFLDQAFHHPFVYFPVFFSVKTFVEGQPWPDAAIQKYRNEIWDSMKACWSIWVPAQVVNFAFVPRHLRIPYVAAVSFVWTVTLSLMQGKIDDSQYASTDSGSESEQNDS